MVSKFIGKSKSLMIGFMMMLMIARTMAAITKLLSPPLTWKPGNIRARLARPKSWKKDFLRTVLRVIFLSFLAATRNL